MSHPTAASCPHAARVAAQLADPAARLSPELAAHLPGCPECRAHAADAIRLWPTDRSPSPSLPEWLSAPSGPATLSAFQAEAVARGRYSDLELGPYLLLDRLGAGGMGEVFRAWHRILRREDAVKRIRPRMADSPAAVARFLREAATAAKLDHPNVVRVYTADRDADGFYLAMEYVPGSDLVGALRRAGRLPVAVACDYVRQAAEGLHHAFTHGLVHRDVKPANLLLADGPPATVKVADFGLARALDPHPDDHDHLTAAGVMMGTPHFMAPEQARDARTADTRSDVYALGCTLFYLLTGRPPFGDSAGMELVNRHLTVAPPPVSASRADVPPAVEAVVRKCLAKRPEDRYQTPGELAAALRTIRSAPPDDAALPATVATDPTPVEATATLLPPDDTDPVEPRAEPRRPDRRWVWAVAGVAILAVAAAAGRSLWKGGTTAGVPPADVPPNGRPATNPGPPVAPPKAVAPGVWKPAGEFKSPRTDGVLVVGFGANGVVIAGREGGKKDGTDCGWLEVWDAGGGTPIRSGRPKGLNPFAGPRAVSVLGDVVLFDDFARYGTGDGFPALKPLSRDLDRILTGAKVVSVDAAAFTTGGGDRPADRFVAATAVADYNGGRRRFVGLWESDTGTIRTAYEVKTGHDVKSVAVDGEGLHLAVWTRDGDVIVRDMNQLHRSWPTVAGSGRYSGVALTPDGRTVYAGHPGEKVVYAWDVQKNTRGRRLEVEWQPDPLVVSADGRWLAAGGGGVRVWDLTAGPEAFTDLWPAWSGGFAAVAFSADGKRLVVGGTAGKDRSGGVWVWELKR